MNQYKFSILNTLELKNKEMKHFKQFIQFTSQQGRFLLRNLSSK